MKNLIIIICALLVAAGFYFFGSNTGNIGDANYRTVQITSLNATTTSATSSAITLKGAKKVSFAWTTDASATGFATSTLTVTGTLNGTNYFALNKLVDNVANSNSQTVTRVASKSLSTDTTNYLLSLDLQHDALSAIKVSANMLGTATNTVTTFVEF